MDAIDFLTHLLSFAAPAIVTAAVVALAGRWLGGKGVQRSGWWACFAINFIAGMSVLAAGLWYFGRDGKMVTYAAMVLAVATAQWLAGRGWRG